MRRACNVVALWPPTLGGADQTAYIARSLGIGKADLDAAFRECKGKYQSVVFYTDPPPGRSTIMIDWSTDRLSCHFTAADVREVAPAQGGSVAGKDTDAQKAHAVAGAERVSGGWNAAVALNADTATHGQRSDKHELLLNNFSSARRRDGSNLARTNTAGTMGAARTGFADESGVKAVEISAPMSQGFAFLRQKRAFLPDMQFTFSYTINNDAAKDAFYTEFIPSVSSGIAGTTAGVNGSLLPAIPAAAAAPKLIIEDLYADLMFAVPRVSIPRPPSIQVPFQGLSVYHRQLTNNSTFTEVFSGIPASIGLVLWVSGTRRTPYTTTVSSTRSEVIQSTASSGFRCNWAL